MRMRGRRVFVLCRILAPHFTAGISVDKVVHRAPPIVKYMIGWQISQVEDYCRKKGWTLELVPEKIN